MLYFQTQTWKDSNGITILQVKVNEDEYHFVYIFQNVNRDAHKDD